MKLASRISKIKRLFLPSFIASLFLFLLLISCHKTTLTTNKQDSDLISADRTYFEAFVLPQHNADTSVDLQHFRMALHKWPDWSKAYVDNLGAFGPTVTVPVRFKEQLHLSGAYKSMSINEMTYLLIYQDAAGQKHCEVVTKTPDLAYAQNTSPSKTFSGNVTVEDWAGHFLKGYNFVNGAIEPSGFSVVKTETKNGNMAQKSNVQANTSISTDDCPTVDWYACLKDESGELYDCDYISSTITCEISWINTTGSAEGVLYNYSGSGSGGGGGTSAGPSYTDAANQYIQIGPQIPIADIAGYLSCFGSGGQSYSVTLYVDQPVNNSSAPYSVGGSGSIGTSGGSGSGSSSIDGAFDVGHTFLALTEVLASGAVITRYMGFYPKTSANPSSPTAPGVIGDDENHNANISLTINVLSSQFNAIMYYMSQASVQTYSLNQNNCTTYALAALGNGGISMDPPRGSWPMGGGDDPGDLGQYLRTMPLGSNMTLNTNQTQAGYNIGTCN